MSNRSLSLIVRLPNWVGDVIMALPALQALQQSGLTLHLVGKPWITDLLAGTDMDLVPLPRDFIQSIKTLTRLESSKMLLMTNSFSSAGMARLAGKKISGYKTDGRSILLNAGMVKTRGQHEVQYFWDIARFMLQSWFKALPWPQDIPNKLSLPFCLTTQTRVKQRLHQAKITSPFWVLCPFAQGTNQQGESKIWPHWREFINQLSPKTLVVCPGKNEASLCAELGTGVTVLADLNLQEYAAVLSQAERVIANDSGPMHIAAAVGVDTLGIFGVSDPHRTRPWGGDYIGDKDHWPSLSSVLNHIGKASPQMIL